MERDAQRYLRLLRYAAPYWRGWAIIFAVSIVGAGFGLLQPWPMKVLVDHILGSAPMPDSLATVLSLLPGTSTANGLLAWVVSGGLVIFAANSVVEVVSTIGWVRVGQRMVYDLARDLFAHIQRRSLLFHTRTPVGDSMSRILGDSWCVNAVVNSFILTPIQALALIIGITAVMARMDVPLTLLSLAVAPAMAITSVWLGKPIRTAAKQGREVQSRIQAHVQQTLSGIPVVQVFAQEDREHQRFLEYAGKAIQAQQRVTLVSSLFNLGSGLIVTVGTAFVLWIGSRRVISSDLTVGDLLVFLAYLNSLQTQFKKLTNIYGNLQKTNAGMDRALDVLEAPLEVTDRPGAVELSQIRGRIQMHDVTFGHDTNRPVLRGISLKVEPGQILAVVGPTGAGKSTLMSLIPRFYDPWSGQVLLDDRDIRDFSVASLRRQIGIVLQEPYLLRATITENIAFGRPKATRNEIEVAARIANAEAFIQRLPEGFDTVLGDRGATLSGGERQRLSIARALLRDAPILILDEPTSALDTRTEALVLEALSRLMNGRTTLIIAHRLSTVREADCILVLEDGTIVEHGRHSELLARKGRYARLYRSQFQNVSERGHQ